MSKTPSRSSPPLVDLYVSPTLAPVAIPKDEQRKATSDPYRIGKASDWPVREGEDEQRDREESGACDRPHVKSVPRWVSCAGARRPK